MNDWSTNEPDPATFHGVSVRYGKRRVLDDLSLTIPRGSVYALLGRNGVGKTSTIRCLLGQQKPTAGEVRLFGRNAWKHRAWAMTRIGVVPEEPDAPPDMRVDALGAFCGALCPSWNQQTVNDRLTACGISGKSVFRSLSKGQKAEVQLALALGASPQFLVLDDPTLGLDVIARRTFFEELVGDLADRGTTVLVTTHDLGGIEGIADRVGILSEGRLIIDEELEVLKARFRRLSYRSETGESTLSGFDRVRVRTSHGGIEAIVSNYTDEAFSHLRSTIGISDATATSLSLEEVFAVLVGDDLEGDAR